MYAQFSGHSKHERPTQQTDRTRPRKTYSAPRRTDPHFQKFRGHPRTASPAALAGLVDFCAFSLRAFLRNLISEMIGPDQVIDYFCRAREKFDGPVINVSDFRRCGGNS